MGKLSAKQGLPPGSVVYVGQSRSDLPKKAHLTLSVIAPNKTCASYEADDFAKLPDLKTFEPGSVAWCDLCGLHDVGNVRAVCERFSIHALIQEDIVNTEELCKFEDYDDCLFFVIKQLDGPEHAMEQSQIALVLGPNYILTFREHFADDCFAPVKQRLAQGAVRMKNGGSDFLLYSLLDVIVDRYFTAIEELDTRVSTLEKTMAATLSGKSVNGRNIELEQIRELSHLKDWTHRLRKIIRGMNNVININTLDESDLVTPQNLYYFKDLADHVRHLNEMIDSLQENCANISDLWMGMLSYRMNNVMQVLAVISTIFIPLTFLAGLYGMNFENMPELQTRYGYFITLGVMLLIAGVMILFFHRKNWL